MSDHPSRLGSATSRMIRSIFLAERIFQSLLTIFRHVDDKAILGQTALDESSDLLFVFDNQDVHGRTTDAKWSRNF